MRIVWVAILSCLAAACTTLPNTLAPDQVATFRLASVEISAPDATAVSWSEGETAFAATRGLGAHNASDLAQTPEARLYLRTRVATRLKEAFERALTAKLAGTRPVRVKVDVKVLAIPSAGQRILVGGNPSMLATVTLTDAASGAVLIVYRDQVSSVPGGAGLIQTLVTDILFSPALDRLSERYADDYARWLTRG